MRGLEGVWRGASRHQSLIICLPNFTAHLLMSGVCGDGVERMKGRKECGSHTRDGEEKGRSVDKVK